MRGRAPAGGERAFHTAYSSWWLFSHLLPRKIFAPNDTHDYAENGQKSKTRGLSPRHRRRQTAGHDVVNLGTRGGTWKFRDLFCFCLPAPGRAGLGARDVDRTPCSPNIWETQGKNKRRRGDTRDLGCHTPRRLPQTNSGARVGTVSGRHSPPRRRLRRRQGGFQARPDWCRGDLTGRPGPGGRSSPHAASQRRRVRAEGRGSGRRTRT